MARPSMPAHAHREHRFGGLFHSASLAEACQPAREEPRVVFVYVTGPNGRASPYLEKPTREDSEVIALLLREAVPIKLNLAYAEVSSEPSRTRLSWRLGHVDTPRRSEAEPR